MELKQQKILQIIQKTVNQKKNITIYYGRVEALEKQPKNIERVSLISNPVEILVSSASSGDRINVNIPLSDSIEKYKYIEIQYNLKYLNGNTAPETKFIATNQLKYNETDTINYEDDSAIFLTQAYDATETMSTVLHFKNSNCLFAGIIFSNSVDYKGIRIKNIYGIN